MRPLANRATKRRTLPVVLVAKIARMVRWLELYRCWHLWRWGLCACEVLDYCINCCTTIIHGFFVPLRRFFFSSTPILSNPAIPSEKRARHDPLTCTPVLLQHESMRRWQKSAYARQSGGLIRLPRYSQGCSRVFAIPGRRGGVGWRANVRGRKNAMMVKKKHWTLQIRL